MNRWPRKPKRHAPWVKMRSGIKPHGWKEKPAASSRKTRSRLKPRSRSYETQMRIYRVRVKIFLASNSHCAVFKNLQSTQCHHRFGRRGRLLLWEPGWRAVSAEGQSWIHSHPIEARKRGLIGPVGTWNDYDLAVKTINLR